MIALVVGLGPSLERYKAEFEELRQANPDSKVFGVNRIFRAECSFVRPVDFYVAVDRTCWRYDHREIFGLKCERFFLPSRYETFVDGRNLVLFDLAKDPLHVATDPGDAPGHGHSSIVVAMQFAAMGGCREIHLFGVDCAPSCGKSHIYGNIARKEKIWDLMRAGTKNCLRCMAEKNILCVVHSDIFPKE